MKKVIFAVSALLIISNLYAQQAHKIFINEFLASNVSIDADIVDFDDYSDWVELYNDEDFDVNIFGYYITDDLNNPYKWQFIESKFQFTESIIIPAKGFLRVWADGHDDVPGNTYRRSYLPYNNFTTKYYHLNFKLSRGGEEIGFYTPQGVLIDSVIFGLQMRDVSMGRFPDGGDEWYYFGEPTAGASNSTEPADTFDFTESPAADLGSGMYSGSQSVILSSVSDSGSIRYTLDGSKPSSSSDSFAARIDITQNTVLLANLEKSFHFFWSRPAADRSAVGLLCSEIIHHHCPRALRTGCN